MGLLVACVAVLNATSAWGELSGTEWRRLAQIERFAYVLGVVDAWRVLVSVPNNTGRVSPHERSTAALVRCSESKKVTGEQAEAIVQKYMEQNPAEWSGPMAGLVWFAFYKACKEN